mgnify:CR=1 FL=1
MLIWADKFENLPFIPQRVQSGCTKTALKFSRQIYSNTSDATQTVAIPTIPIIKVSIV